MAYTSDRFQAQFYIAMRDRSYEPSGVQVYVPETMVLEDANSNGIPDNALLVAFVNAVDAITAGEFERFTLTQSLRFATTTPVAGQREQKYLVTYRDTVNGKLGTFTIPTRPDSIQPPVGTDLYDLTIAPWPAFVAAANALIVSEDGNGALVSTVRLVGRNN